MRAPRISTFFLAALALALPVHAEDARETPQEAFEAFRKAAKSKDAEAIWNFFSTASRKKLVEDLKPGLEEIRSNQEYLEEFAQLSGKTVEEVKKMDAQEFAKTSMVTDIAGSSEKLDETQWAGAEVKGHSATVKLNRKAGGDVETVYLVLVLEEGRWCADMGETDKLNLEMVQSETPQEAFEAFKQAALEKDPEAVWNFFSEASKKEIIDQIAPKLEEIRKDADTMSGLAKATGKSEEELREMGPEEFAEAMVSADVEPTEKHARQVEWVSAKVDGKVAVCITKDAQIDPKGGDVKMVLVLERGMWKLDNEATEKARGK